MRLLRRDDLRRYQRIFINKVKRIFHIILALDMGAGKTAIVLTALLDLLDDEDIEKVLIVAPLLVAKATWPDEIEQWQHTRLLTYTVLRVEDDDPEIVQWERALYRLARILGLDFKRSQAFASRALTRLKEEKLGRLAHEGTEVHIINREALPWLWEFFGNGKRWPYDTLVVDEASMFKNGKMRTPKKGLSRFGAAARARKLATRTILMTGTPSPKGLQNLWGLAFIADLGERLGAKKYDFERRWFTKDYMGWNIEPRPKALEQITDRLSDIMFSLDPDDYPEIPDVTYVDRKVTLPKKVMDAYHQFHDTLVSEEYDVEAFNQGVLHQKLLQFANGSMYREDGSDVWIHDEKLDSLTEIIEEADGDPLLVAYSFKFDLARIRKRFKKAVVFGEGDVRRTKAAWNAGDIEILLAHPASMGHGQNVQYGGNLLAWYGLTPDLELYLQMNKRLARPGQTRKVTNFHIIAKGTYDEKIIPILQDRKATQDDVLYSLRVPAMVKK